MMKTAGNIYRTSEIREANAVTVSPAYSPDLPDSCIVHEVCRRAVDNPGFGQYVVAEQLKKLGIMLTPAKIRSIWMRHGLETFEKRFTALVRELSADQGVGVSGYSRTDESLRSEIALS